MKILILSGGVCGEKVVSKKSGDRVADALTQMGHQVLRLDPGNMDFLQDLYALQPNIDLVFNCLHGKYGEDGRIPAILDVISIPYTHSGVEASVIGMNKVLTREICCDLGSKIPKYIEINQNNYQEALASKVGQSIMQNQYFIKPINAGSSLGVHMIKEGVFFQFDDSLFRNYKSFIVEEAIVGREFNITILNDRAYGTVEVVQEHDFFDQDTKFDANCSDFYITNPERLDSALEEEMRNIALRIHRKLWCRHLSRVEFIYGKTKSDTKDKIYFLEINTHPGLSEHSITPLILQKNNIDFTSMLSSIIS